MLLHIRPRLLSPYRDVVLESLVIEPFGLSLFNGADLMTGRPYRNKWYSVGHRRNSHSRALDGILIETPSIVTEFSCFAKWLVEGLFIATHRVGYQVVDQDFELASQNMMLWYGRYDGSLADRRPEASRKTAPVFTEPVMELIPNRTVRPGTVDVIDKESGWIVERRQVFAMPTIERERLLCTDFTDRMPLIESAFRVGEVPERPGFGTCMLCGRPSKSWCGCSREPEL